MLLVVVISNSINKWEITHSSVAEKKRGTDKKLYIFVSCSEF